MRSGGVHLRACLKWSGRGTYPMIEAPGRYVFNTRLLPRPRFVGKRKLGRAYRRPLPTLYRTPLRAHINCLLFVSNPLLLLYMEGWCFLSATERWFWLQNKQKKEKLSLVCPSTHAGNEQEEPTCSCK
jgi:hypothetical protein